MLRYPRRPCDSSCTRARFAFSSAAATSLRASEKEHDGITTVCAEPPTRRNVTRTLRLAGPFKTLVGSMPPPTAVPSTAITTSPLRMSNP